MLGIICHTMLGVFIAATIYAAIVEALRMHRVSLDDAEQPRPRLTVSDDTAEYPALGDETAEHSPLRDTP